jgi:Ca2+-binding RTX toxin-like protein
MTTYFESTNIFNAASDGVDLTDTDNDDSLFIVAGVTVAGGTNGTDAVGASSTGGGINAEIDGTLWGSNTGLEFDGGNNVITIGTAGSIIGENFDGIVLSGSDNIITNNGEISSDTTQNYSVIDLHSFAQGGNTVINNGLIVGSSDIDMVDGGNTLDNSGVMDATKDGAVGFSTPSGMTDTIDNSGTIESPSTAVWEKNTGALSVTNSGEIHGGSSAVVFQTTAGTDTLDNTGLITSALDAVHESGSADLTVINSGTISGSTAIVFDGTADSLDNSGTIRSNIAGGYAINEGGGSLDITNSGHIAGGIIFFGANNVYDGTLGSVTGWVTGGSGTNNFTGGAGTDHFDGGAGIVTLDGMGGNDVLMAEGTQATIDGGDGNDTINMASYFNASDQIDGGDGKDTLVLNGNYSAGVVMGADTLTNVEKIVLTNGFAYNLTTDDNTVAAGARLVVDGSTLTNSLIFDGSAETDGRFVITGGTHGDTLTGGAGNDVINGGAGKNIIDGGGGADNLTGGGNSDTFVYTDVSDSTSTRHDIVNGFNAADDLFNLDVTVTGINTEVSSGHLSTGNFDANLASAIGAGQLAAGHAVLFTPTLGGLAGHTFLIIDANGVAGYQAGQDYVIELVGATNLSHLVTGDFV